MATKQRAIFNCRQAARFLGVHVKTIRYWAHTGKLSGKKVGPYGDWLFARDELLNVMATWRQSIDVRQNNHERQRTEQLLLEQKSLLECIAVGHPLDECLTALTGAVTRLEPHTRASIVLADAAYTKVSEVYAADIPPSFGMELKDLPINEQASGPCGTAIYSGQPIACADIAHDESWSRTWRNLCMAHGILACYSAPVISTSGKSLASFMLCFDEAREPNAWELQIAQFGTYIASIAIERDRTMQALRDSKAKLAEELADMQQLQHISSQLIQENTIDVLYQQILDGAIALMRSDAGSMQILFPEKNELRLLSWKGFDSASAAFWGWVHVDSASTCGLALRMGERVIVPDVASCDFIAGTDDLASYILSGIKAVQSTPLISRSGRIVGVISTHWHQQHHPSERELHLLDVLARQAADLIERRRAEEALRRSEEQLAAFFHSAAVGIAVLTPTTKFLQVNETFCRIVGYAHEELASMDCIALTHPDDCEPMQEKIAVLIAGRIPTFVIEKRYIRQDGTLIWVQNSVSLTHDSARQPLHLVMLCQDITEQKKAEEALKHSEEKFRTLANNISQLVWMANADGWIYWYNQRWYDYTGTSLQVVQGWGWQRVHHPDHVQRVVAKIRHCFQMGEVWEDTFPLRGKDGGYRWFLSRAIPIRDEQGKIIRWFGTNTDITKQKQLEQQKDEFLGIASHELKTPLTSLKGYAQLLEHRFRTVGDEHSATLLKKMDGQIDRLTMLIKDFLDVTKLENGQLQLHITSFDFNALVREMVEEAQRITTKQRIVLEVSAPVTLSADRDRIGQVLTNLLTNAIKYAPSAEIITVKTVCTDKTVITSVQDGGMGIPKEKQQHLFERFFRVEGVAESHYPGLGLGLYISAQFVKRHHGSIWVESEEGKGAIFSFTLPLHI